MYACGQSYARLYGPSRSAYNVTYALYRIVSPACYPTDRLPSSPALTLSEYMETTAVLAYTQQDDSTLSRHHRARTHAPRCSPPDHTRVYGGRANIFLARPAEPLVHTERTPLLLVRIR